MKRLSIASVFLALAQMAMPSQAGGIDVHTAARKSLAERRIPYLYAGADDNPATDRKRPRIEKILASLDDEDVVAVLREHHIKIDLGIVPQGSMAQVNSNVITVNIMAPLWDQVRAIGQLASFIKSQKADNLPYQPACFGAGFSFNTGLKLIPQGC